MLSAISRNLRQARRRLGLLLALTLLIGTFVFAHSLCAAGPMNMSPDHGMSDGAAICLFIVEAGALGFALALLGGAGRRGWRIRRVAVQGVSVPLGPLTAAPSAPARAGPLLQVFRL